MLFDSGATNSFVSLSYVLKLNLSVSFVLTSQCALKCLLKVENRSFVLDLICLPLDDIDVILGMDWLSSNWVFLNCSERSISFDDMEVSQGKILMPAK